MSKRIFKQPNGLYAIWSTVADDFVVYDALRDELIADLLADARREVVKTVDAAIARADGHPPDASGPGYPLSPTTYGECLRTIAEMHGDAIANSQHQQMSTPPPARGD